MDTQRMFLRIPSTSKSPMSEPRPRHIRLQEIRDRLTDIRTEVSDIADESNIQKDALRECEGGITCVMVFMYTIIQDLEQYYDQWEKQKQDGQS